MPGPQTQHKGAVYYLLTYLLTCLLACLLAYLLAAQLRPRALLPALDAPRPRSDLDAAASGGQGPGQPACVRQLTGHVTRDMLFMY